MKKKEKIINLIVAIISAILGALTGNQINL